jgi:uncharacterized protein (DUF1800 family)
VPVDQRLAVRRLLQRVGFGPRPGQLDQAAAAGFAATLDAMLSEAPEDLPTAPSLHQQPDGGDRKLVRSQVDLLRLWWLQRMAATERPLVERLTFFWHDVFATSVQKVRDASLMLHQN